MQPASLAASNPCLNCGTNIQLDYCPECGQREIDADPTLREFLDELAAEFLNWDGKALKTLRLLLIRPGELTMEYLAGRRVRFISPLRLYLACSVLYFFLAALVPTRSIRTGAGGVRSESGLLTISTPDTGNGLATLDSLARTGSLVKRTWGVHFARAMRNTAQLTGDTTAAVPRAMFVLLPIFAWLFAVGFRDRRRRYPQHLAFALHVHAVLFLALTVLLLGRVTSNVVAQTGLQLLIGAAMGVYMLLASRRVYGGDRAGILARLVGVFVAYFAAFLAALAAIFVLVVLRT